MADMFEDAYRRHPTVFGLVPSPGLPKAVEELRRPTGCTALDLGCGQGRDSLFLLSKGLAVTAVDQSPAGIAALRAQAPAHLAPRLTPVTADVTDVRTWRGVYDLVVGTTILDHLPSADGRRVLDASMACLRRGGVIYLCVHTVSDPGYTKIGDISEFSEAILHYFKPNELLTWTLETLTVLRYEDRIETDYDHGPVHQHGLAYLVGRKEQ